MSVQSQAIGRNRKFKLQPQRNHYRRNQVTLSESWIQRSDAGEQNTAYTATQDKSAEEDAFLCEWLEYVQFQLDEIESLPAGWDSNGASSPVQDWVESARNFIESLAQAESVPQPYVNPCRSGGVQFEWESGPRYFEVEIVGEGTAIFFYCDTEKHEEVEGNLEEGDSLQDALHYIHRVFTT